MNKKSGSRLTLTLIVDEGTGIATRVAKRLREALQDFDLCIQRADELRDCLKCTLIAPQAFLLGLQVSNIRLAVVELPESQAKSSLAEILAGISDDLVDDADRKYSAVSVASPHWLVILSGGGNGGDFRCPPQMARRLADRSLTVIPIVLGHESDPMMMAAFGPYRPPLQLEEGNELRWSSWLTKELLRVARSKPGERVFLDVSGMEAWARI